MKRAPNDGAWHRGVALARGRQGSVLTLGECSPKRLQIEPGRLTPVQMDVQQVRALARLLLDWADSKESPF